ncbi:MAG: hypothetical protein RSA52_06090 [Acetivibrio sp.]
MRPFDAASKDDISIYNKLPYFRDIELCPPEMITLVTGNVIKYFQYSIKDIYPLANMDTLAVEKICEYQKREENNRISSTNVAGENSLTTFKMDDSESSDLSEEASDVSLTEVSEKKERPSYLDLDFE